MNHMYLAPHAYLLRVLSQASLDPFGAFNPGQPLFHSSSPPSSPPFDTELKDIGVGTLAAKEAASAWSCLNCKSRVSDEVTNEVEVCGPFA
jgi:hypothetical protein